MKNWKTLLILALTAALILGCGLLPRIVAAVQDGAAASGSGFSDMQSVSLILLSGEGESRPLLSKLALLRDGAFYQMFSGETAIQASRMETIVRDGLARYYEAELIPDDWTKYEFTATPYLVYAGVNALDYGIFWVVTIRWPESKDHLELYVDDETGLILYLHYNTSAALEVYTPEGYLDALSDAYFDSTGISTILAAPEKFGVEDVVADDSGLEVSGDKFYTRTLRHLIYNDLTFEFHLYQNGFYILIR